MAIVALLKWHWTCGMWKSVSCASKCLERLEDTSGGQGRSTYNWRKWQLTETTGDAAQWLSISTHCLLSNSLLTYTDCRFALHLGKYEGRYAPARTWRWRDVNFPQRWADDPAAAESLHPYHTAAALMTDKRRRHGAVRCDSCVCDSLFYH